MIQRLLLKFDDGCHGAAWVLCVVALVGGLVFVSIIRSAF